MKKRSKELIKSIGYTLSFIFPYTLFNNLKKLKTFLFSGYIKRQFKHAGDNLMIESPIYIKGGQYINIGNNFTALARFWIDAYDKYESINYNPQIIIGDNVSFNYNCHLACINKIIIGNNVLAASSVYITDHFHGDINNNEISPKSRPLVSKGPVIIRDNVWIGEAVVIMPNVTIGKNSIIGANSVVTKSFGDCSLIAGIPAKLIRILE